MEFIELYAIVGDSTLRPWIFLYPGSLIINIILSSTKVLFVQQRVEIRLLTNS